ncbi:hypothetical protein SAMN05421690_1001205 [Nitrosomonas sp. Nm51]|nr:hypothetical protein SAMN05421690_1001205 [Nitrosomonas sp. Nm51]
MNIEELYHLASWLKKEATTARDKYEAVRAKLQHNAQQQQKQPLEGELNALIEFLDNIPLHVLSNEQTRLLESFGVANYFGSDGVSFVNARICFDNAGIPQVSPPSCNDPDRSPNVPANTSAHQPNWPCCFGTNWQIHRPDNCPPCPAVRSIAGKHPRMILLSWQNHSRQ